jgi:GNAT superfamily N-acetyltransferase
MKVRRATLQDVTAIAECLGELGYNTSSELVSQRLAQLRESDADRVFVAQSSSNGQIVGVICAHALPLFHVNGSCVRLTALAMRRSAQRTGVGRSLVAAAEQWAWASGARKIEVTSGEHRPVAHRFYTSMGYSLGERRFLKAAQAPRVSGS